MTPRISIAMATYNGEKYLGEQLESLARQTVAPHELVVCDDGSTDATVRIVEDFAKRTPFPVRIFVNERNLGFSDNFMKAARLCQGEWISFCDQDDVWLPRKVERIATAIVADLNEETMMIGHTSLLSDSNLKLTGQKLPDFKNDQYVDSFSRYAHFCIVGFSMCCHSALIREYDWAIAPRKWWRQNGQWRPIGHDQWLGTLAHVIGRVYCVAEPLAIWRRHDLSLTRPPARSSFVRDTLISISAVSPSAYLAYADLAKQCSESFEKLRKVKHDDGDILARRLGIASQRFNALSIYWKLRAELYLSIGLYRKASIFCRLLKGGAYLGEEYTSIGRRALLKDLVFTLGII